ncbi:MAG: potassium transporter [Planctomycetes bacterium]|nr:potassium transporter [Planctomycetota bacterium]
MHFSPFLEDLALVLCVAAVTSVVFRRLRQPVVLGYLLAGLIVGPYTPITPIAGRESLETTAELGVILVMFSIGLEFSLRKLMRVFPRAGLVGLIEIGAMFWLGYSAARLLGWSALECQFAGAIVSISSTMIIARLFAERGVSKKLSDLVLGVLVIEDVAAILMLAVLTALAGGEAQTEGFLANTAGRLTLFLVALTAGGYLFVPRVIRAVARLGSPETLLVAGVGLCFAFALLAQRAGYSVALGAFLAGSLVAESGRARQLAALIAPLRDLFAAMFFVSVGSLVDPTAVLEHWGAIVVFCAVVVVGKVLSVSLGAFLSGYDPSTALQAGMSMPQIGEFSFILAGVGVSAHAISPALGAVAVSVSVVTTFLTPWLVRVSGPLALSIEHRLPKPLRTFASLYASWLEELRRGKREKPLRYQLVGHAAWLALDVLCFAGVVIGTSLYLERLVSAFDELLSVSHDFARTLVLCASALASLPFLIGIVRLSRALGAELATAALPPRPDGMPDLAAAPRRAFVVALQLAIVIVVGGPLLALTQPFVPILYQAGVVLSALAALAFSFWRRANDLEAHVQAGAQVVVEVLRRQGDSEGLTLEDVQPLLPGLGEVTPVRLGPKSVAVGKTLAELDLRAKTGASVIAVTRAQGEVIAPTGRETLRALDVLALAGSRASVQAACNLLEAHEVLRV